MCSQGLNELLVHLLVNCILAVYGEPKVHAGDPTSSGKCSSFNSPESFLGYYFRSYISGSFELHLLNDSNISLEEFYVKKPRAMGYSSPTLLTFLFSPFVLGYLLSASVPGICLCQLLIVFFHVSIGSKCDDSTHL